MSSSSFIFGGAVFFFLKSLALGQEAQCGFATTIFSPPFSVTTSTSRLIGIIFPASVLTQDISALQDLQFAVLIPPF